MSESGPDATAPFAALSQFDFHARLADSAGPALILFTAAGCGSCRHLRGVLREVRRREPAWRIYEVDAQRDRAVQSLQNQAQLDAALTNEFEVFHLPTVFLFNDGNFHCQLQAEAGPSAIISATRSALQQAPQEAP